MKTFKRFKRKFSDWSSKRRFRIPKMLTLDFYGKILAAPILWLGTNWKSRRFQNLLFGLPAMAGIFVILYLGVQLQVQEPSISTEYLAEARSALTQKDFTRAELLLARVLKRRDSIIAEAQYSMAVLFDETGQKDRASEFFRILAPDDRRGNRDGHRRLAVILANQANYESEASEFRRLHWHLTAAGQSESADTQMAWGRYYLLTGDLKQAKKYFELSVKQFPQVWQVLGEIEARLGQTASAILSFQESSKYLSRQLTNDPSSASVRTDYAQVLMKLGQLDDAQMVLEQGRLLNPDGPWPQLLASLAVNYHDMMFAQGTPISDLLTYLSRALQYDPNHGLALNRLMSYATAKVEGNIELRTILARVIAEGKEPGLAHLAMGNLCWLEEDHDQALFHFNQATKIRDDVPVLLNNMAWLIAHDPNAPDLDRSLALVNSALTSRPDNPHFLDTRGTIYCLKKEWESALPDLEKALAGIKDKKSVHQKLAEVYDNLKMSEIAEQHRILAESLAQETAAKTVTAPR